MDFRADKVDASIGRLDALVGELLAHAWGAARGAIERWRSDAAALRFHLRQHSQPPLLVAVLGGTGTGKSTLVNRLLGQTVSATSFRRTFTAGAVAIVAEHELPHGWLGVEHVGVPATDLPVRGRAGVLLVVEAKQELARRIMLIDTPDLDGDQPAHHAEADRVFRWADAVLFLVTPEKYQMTELLPYYRLAVRYALPALFVMNKCEQQAVADDYAGVLKAQGSELGVQGSGFGVRTSASSGFDELSRVVEPGSGQSENHVFVVPRDDAGYEPPARQNVTALREALINLKPAEPSAHAQGLGLRTGDMLGRLADQVAAPLGQDRQEVDRLIVQLRAMETPALGVDVNPVTQQLQRRMQQRSVLYLMGPQRVLDRVRQAPGLLVRLPRVAWDYVMHGQVSPGALNPNGAGNADGVPDFQAILTDQFNVLQSRLDDALRASPLLRPAAPEQKPVYQEAFINASEAGQIAAEELAQLRAWLEQRWNATPRDTRMLESLLKYLPGGRRITKWTEAAPYLLVVIVVAATHHLFGQIDLIVLGGWSLATWLTEKLSNEVAARTRQTNQRITDRFARLAHQQIEKLCRWLDERAPTTKALHHLDQAMEEARRVADVAEPG